ncbi:PE-PPE domain-containing protein [Mycobacterium sp.]|uniref:PE-PPE domain-containing protein n=1 Tax=Mycobacterium sp. TaxID=1785 RepID=UPI0031DE9E3A
MTARGVRFLSLGLFATAGVGLLGVTAAMHAPFAYGDDVTLVYGGSGLPIPSQEIVDNVTKLFVTPILPDYTVANAQSAFTPEGFYPNDPLTGVKSLAGGPSTEQGLVIMDGDIKSQVAAGNDVVVFGYSQSSGIATEEEENLAADLANKVPNTPEPDQVQFVLIGDPAGEGSTLPDTPYTTDIYALQYDGVTQPPAYPINVLADLNAALGFLFVHSSYPALTTAPADELAPNGDVLLTTLHSSAGGTINYYLIPTQNLPLLDVVRDVSVIGQPLADLLQPDLKVLVDLGYGAGNLGYVPPSFEPYPVGVSPDVSPLTVLGELATGAQQGVRAFVSDLPQVPANLESVLSQVPAQVAYGLTHLNELNYITILSTLLGPGAAQVLEGEYAPVASLNQILPTPSGPFAPVTEFVNAVSSAASFDYSILEPTADNLLTLAQLPLLDVGAFAEELSQGNIVDALGLPVALDVGEGTDLFASETEVFGLAVMHTIGDFTALIPSM